MAQQVRNLPTKQEVKASACNVGDLGSRLGFNPCVGNILWRRKWQPTAVFLPGKSQGQTKEPGGLQSMGLQRVRHG